MATRQLGAPLQELVALQGAIGNHLIGRINRMNLDEILGQINANSFELVLMGLLLSKWFVFDFPTCPCWHLMPLSESGKSLLIQFRQGKRK